MAHPVYPQIFGKICLSRFYLNVITFIMINITVYMCNQSVCEVRRRVHPNLATDARLAKEVYNNVMSPTCMCVYIQKTIIYI